MPKPKSYQLIDTCVCFNFGTLFKNINNDLRNKRTDLWGDGYVSAFIQELNKFSLNGQTFEYISAPVGLGGLNFYVLCPKCKHKKKKLYLPNKYSDREQLYLCSICHRLKNYSNMNYKTKKYQKVIKPLKKLEAIKRHLLKGTLSSEKSAELIKKYEEIENSLKNSPEYRIWLFNAKHGGKE